MTTRTYDPENPYRIARTVVPHAYRLRLRPDLDAATFMGSVEVTVTIAEQVRSIVMNAIELDVQPATVTVDGRIFHSSAPVLDDEYETATFTFDQDLPVGAATLAVSFRGVLNDQLRGFYRSTFEDAQGRTHVIATTQFATTDARRAFPCWDDPAVKSTYQLTLEVPESLAGFANTRELSTRSIGEGYREVTFAESMIMSTYLVAFVVGDFEASSETAVAGTTLRVIYPIGNAHLIDWAREAAVHALEFFSNYFAIPYPGDKVDLIAIPDFAAGAMENLGLITFRETDLLIDPASASIPELERVALVVNHELAHMWFGDLVTMEWWEGIWLNEAFATFMESLCTDHFRPEWQKWVRFHPQREAAFSVDAQHSTRPIEFRVISPDECRGMFDVLTYVKGCAVLRMLEQYLGETTFRDGIRTYLQRHSYANAVTKDLWAALEETSGQPVGSIMDTWILQGGFPLLRVEGDAVSQEPFSYGPTRGASAIGTSWKVPMQVRSLDGAVETTQLLDGTSATIPVSGTTIVNGGGWGFFRTAYGSDQLRALSTKLGELDALERAVLLADTWSAILVGRSSFSDLFTLARGMSTFDEPSAWELIGRAVALADRILDEEGRVVLRDVVQSLFRPTFTRQGWEPRDGESSQISEMRALVISVLGHQGRDEAIIAEATSRFDRGEVSGNLASAIVSITMAQGRLGDDVVCDERRAAASSPQEEERYLFASADSGDARVPPTAFERAFSEVRTQDAPYLIGALIRNRDAGVEVWRLAAARQSEAIERFAPISYPNYLGGIVSFVDAALAEEVRAFHEANPMPVSQQQVQQLLDVMDVNVAVASRNRATLRDELSAFLSN
ncbi:MAG TPA: M1 family metallopeptidase [Acidimicrobiales bacterium]|nr:M1 family metallopeptidase [Acidimicrobiales bacterium]